MYFVYFRQLPGKSKQRNAIPSKQILSCPSRTRAQHPIVVMWAAVSKTVTKLERRLWQGQNFLIILKLPCSSFSICLAATNLWQFSRILTMLILTVFAWFSMVLRRDGTMQLPTPPFFADTTLTYLSVARWLSKSLAPVF